MAQTLKEFLASNPNASEEQIVQRMQTATEDELIWCCSGYATTNQRRATAAQSILDTRRHRELKKPHWTITPTFYMTIVIFIVAILAWLFPREPMKKTAPIFQPVQSNPATLIYTPMPPTNAALPQPVLPPAGQISPPVSVP
jgi:hypothetical protein